MNNNNGHLEINGYTVDITYDYEYIPEIKGSRNEYGVPIEPNEPATVEISNIKLGGALIELPSELIEELEEELLAEIQS